MSNILIVTKDKGTAKILQGKLSAMGHVSSIASYKDKIAERIVREIPDLVIIETNGQAPAIIRELVKGIKIKHKAAVLALSKEGFLNHPEDLLEVDDFIIEPVDDRELALRMKRLRRKSAGDNEILRCRDMVIDFANCEVRVAGKVVELTFKEYELLTFLARNRGRVYTRESLLNKVWGYDYYGGDRTVDVHVRRLRSKIETTDQAFIETVRNIGYRFISK
ncbi:MAG: response regulator transcription factor [Dehalococcoidales bacterium]|nr:response regulator transcription factor [Dehalococcoidales bacterium]